MTTASSLGEFLRFMTAVVAAALLVCTVLLVSGSYLLLTQSTLP